ncbi:hypothetical protein O3P69_016422 [Scylla paramamosain]|uniref:Uncharacterized protein n=1 Tax=Scylla paramamosain TaxID=85552 RepID=A0AAW0TG69_SCYPA
MMSWSAKTRMSGEGGSGVESEVGGEGGLGSETGAARGNGARNTQRHPAGKARHWSLGVSELYLVPRSAPVMVSSATTTTTTTKGSISDSSAVSTTTIKQRGFCAGVSSHRISMI